MTEEAWKPLADASSARRHRPGGPGAEAFVVSPFTRLARTHAAAVAGDTLIALALAGSLFFSIDPSAARGKIALYLALTMAPFSIVAPFIGPTLDRAKGGRRWIVIGANAARVVVCVPSGVTGVELRAVKEATESAGARQAYTIEEPLAAAIGANKNRDGSARLDHRAFLDGPGGEDPAAFPLDIDEFEKTLFGHDDFGFHGDKL